MSGQENLKKVVAQKMTRRRAGSLRDSDIPERFKDGNDAQDDVTAPKGKMAPYMNQSLFSMIAAAGSRADFHSRFDDDDSSESDDEPEVDGAAAEKMAEDPKVQRSLSSRKGKHRRLLSDRKILKSIPLLGRKSEKGIPEAGESSRPTTSEDNISPSEVDEATSARIAPVMSRKLEAEAQLHSGHLGPELHKHKDDVIVGTLKGSASTPLDVRLMEIFELEAPETVISEYPCWLLQSVLLQGYMYITQKHICFYAYLPKKSNVVVKSGYLSKRGRQNPKYHRYWFTLKGDVLSYYTNPSDLYFPSGHVDLRYGISAELRDKNKDTTGFTVTTDQRTYHFRADSPVSAKEWVKNLQKVIFRTHNEGDSVKIALPTANVIDIEDSPVIDFAETLKIRVIESDETYAIDEYFFSFFSFGKDALNVLRIMVDDTPAQKLQADLLSRSPDRENPRSPKSPRSLREASPRTRDFKTPPRSPFEAPSTPLLSSVRATLAPQRPTSSGMSSPRASGDFGHPSFDTTRRSTEHGRSRGRGRSFSNPVRRSASTGRHSLSREGKPAEKPETKPHGSVDSYVHPSEQGTDSSMVAETSDGTLGSASQILNRSDVFHSPTITTHQHSSQNKNETSRSSHDSDRSLKGAEIRIQPPSRAPTQQELKPSKIQKRDASDESDDDDASDAQTSRLKAAGSGATIQDIVRAGSYPLQRAAGLAGYFKDHSKRMSNLLATESMGYIEKVSGMWAGGRKHYGEAEGMIPDDQLEDLDDEAEDGAGAGDRFRAYFALPPSEKLQATYFGYLHRVLPLYGKVYISNRKFCFRSLLPGTRTKLILPLKDIENVDKEKGFRFGYSGLVIVIRGHEELFFEFSQSDTRDDCAITLLQNLESVRYLQESGLLSREEKDDADTAKAEHQMLQEARQDGDNAHDIKLPETATESGTSSDVPPILFDDPRASIINFKPTESLRFTCLTIGSRGDVQPYIALCKGLIAEGHQAKIATHAEFGSWVKSHGIEFAPVDGDPAELMRICVENGMFTYSFLREASLKFRGWIDQLLHSSWKACQGSDVLIESPSAMAGIHIAEALGIPYFRAFTMPWTRTRAYPHAFAVPEHKMGGAYNYITYVMFDNVFWKAIAGQVNRWRKKELGLQSTNLDKMQPNKVPFLYNFSPHVVVPPLDYSDWIRVTGYWFLDEATGWEPPKELTDFIQKARDDNKKIVYIGFGSIVVSDPAALTKTVIDSVMKADVRCILSKGWSDRLGNKEATAPELPLPKEILQIKSAPHDWLFRQIDAAAHHGGAGTTGASLRAGLPTIIKPFFGDQYFFGSRVEDLGVGICMKRLNVSVFSRALWESTHSERMIVKANVLGEQIRNENGVDTAIQAMYRDMEYARTLIKKRIGGGGKANARDDGAATNTVDPTFDDSEESWTFVGESSDPDLSISKRIERAESGLGRGGGGARDVERKVVEA
ncbi:MAG: hypothetical protein M1819_005784 [Sarea resinae]|nr:MAG: hypothetical protein M1819_005784 [Sarea resinae]